MPEATHATIATFRMDPDRLDAEAFVGNVEANAPNQRAAGVELRSIRVVEVAATA